LSECEVQVWATPECGNTQYAFYIKKKDIEKYRVTRGLSSIIVDTGKPLITAISTC
jgi:hypothetical protein